MLVGILLGWGFGAAAMRAAIAVRDMALVQSQIQQVQAKRVVLAMKSKFAVIRTKSKSNFQLAHRRMESTRN